MNHTEIFQKLVNLLGRSEHDLEVIAVLTELGVKLPLKRPKKDETGYLVDYDVLKQKYGFSLGVEYADTFNNLFKEQNFKDKEMVFYIIQDIEKCSYFEVILFPFGISFDLSPQEAVQILGDYFEYDDFWNCYLWNKNNLVIILNFDDENKMSAISYRLLQDYDLEIINAQKNG